MSKWYCGLFVAMVCLLAAGCVQQRATITATNAAAMVRTGRGLLTCRETCLPDWQRVQPSAAQLEAAARWPELAAAVLQVGYEDDVSLYYLGRAAEGLGYPGAAASYYRQSVRLSGTGAACQYLSRMCGGIAFPRAAAGRLAAIERQVHSAGRRRAPGPVRPGVPAEPADEASPAIPVQAVAPGPPGTAPPWAEPAPTPVAAPEPALASPAPPAPARAPGQPSDFIEPPPAR